MKNSAIRWKLIDGTEDVLVSNFGDVKTKGGFIFKPVDKRGYKSVSLVVNGVRKGLQIHRLVAKAFVANPFGKPKVNHKNGDKSNNCEWNLEWVTDYENQMHRRYVLMKGMDGKDNPMFGMSGVNNPKYVEDVYALTGDGEIAGIFSTQVEAAEKLCGNIKCAQRISRAIRHCKGAITVSGYFFLYKTEYDRLKQAGLKPRELLGHPEMWSHHYRGQSAAKPQCGKQ